MVGAKPHGPAGDGVACKSDVQFPGAKLDEQEILVGSETGW